MDPDVHLSRESLQYFIISFIILFIKNFLQFVFLFSRGSDISAAALSRWTLLTSLACAASGVRKGTRINLQDRKTKEKERDIKRYEL